MNRPFRCGPLMVAVWGVLSPGVAHAYVDPGAAGFVITTVLGFLAAIGYTVRSHLYRLKRWITGKRGKDPDGDARDRP